MDRPPQDARLTERQARKHGYALTRGAFHGTTDDRADRWYVDEIASEVVDRRGAGFRTKAEALDAIADKITQDDYLDNHPTEEAQP